MSLVYASGKGNIVLVRGLLARGTPPNGLPLDASQPFTDAVYLAATFVTPLQEAAREGHDDVVEVLLRYGAHPDAHHEGDTPLNLAASAGHTGVVKILLKAHADRDLTWKGFKPIEHARANGHDDTVAAFKESE